VRPRAVLVVGTLLVALLPALAPGEVYKWVDEKGRVHYGDRPPAAQAPEALTDISVYEPDAAPQGPARTAAPAISPSAAALANCLGGNGTQLYAASWCGQCRKQLGYFGAAAKALPYIECSADGSRKTAPRCETAGIRGYPTWVFPSGQRRSGVLPLKQLALLAGCT
jgi:hypothetical protein